MKKETIFLAIIAAIFILVMLFQFTLTPTGKVTFVPLGAYGDTGPSEPPEDPAAGDDNNDETDRDPEKEDDTGYGNNNQASCSDSDLGKNYDEKGTVTVTSAKGEKTTLVDTCQDNTVLKEYFCDGNKQESALELCSGSCEDGKCLAAETSSGGGGGGSPRIFISNTQSSSETSSKTQSSISAGELVCGNFKLETPKKASANSVFSDSSASKAIDGDFSTNWFGSKQDSYPKIIEFDLQSQKCIDYVNLYFNKWDIPLTLDVQVSNNKQQWDTVISDLEVTYPRLITELLPEISVARYLRIIQTSGKRDFGNLAEIEIKTADLVRQ